MTDGISDEEIVSKVVAGEAALYEVLVHRYRQRLYRICRAILKDDAEASDVVQHTYARAYEHLRQFAGRARFSTWLMTIAIHEATLRRRRRGRLRSLEELGHRKELVQASRLPTPEQQFSLHEMQSILEAVIDALPAKYRVVEVMRDVEGMSVAETAECLGITQETVKVRLHRARSLLRKRLFEVLGPKAPDLFRFHLLRCDRVVRGASDRILAQPSAAGPMNRPEIPASSRAFTASSGFPA